MVRALCSCTSLCVCDALGCGVSLSSSKRGTVACDPASVLPARLRPLSAFSHIGARGSAPSQARARRGVSVVDGGSVFARERMVDIQRARILAALVSVACERGAAGATVAHVVQRSGVSRRTFYETFSDREECFLAAFDDAIERIAERVVPAFEEQDRWSESVRAALIELLCFMQEEPLLARLVVVESLSAGKRAVARRAQLQSVLTHAIDQGSRESPRDATTAASIAAEGVVGGVSAVLAARLTDGAACPDLLSLTGPLMGMIVLPYLGSAAAAREVERPVPRREIATRLEREGTMHLRELGMRLTYRTVRVIAAVAELPGASNRQIGVIAGINDQGQISKLLGRLRRAGLVQNTGTTTGKGTPNAWTLTEQGHAINHSIDTHVHDKNIHTHAHDKTGAV